MRQSDDTDNTPPQPTKHCWFSRWLQRGRRSETQSEFAYTAQSALDSSGAHADAVSKHGTLYRAGVTLADLKPGECGIVRRLFGPTQGRLRLLEMGLTYGTHVQVVRAAAFGGPLDILVRNYQLSLRRDEAAGVWLDDEPDAGTAVQDSPAGE